MPVRVLVALLTALLALPAAAASSSPAAVVRLAPVEDASLPFGCDWSYDWEARCTRDDSARLPIGGDVDKAWRAALRFSLDALPAGAGVQEALLTVFHDGTCIRAGRRDRPCPRRSYALEAHAILAADWYREREVAFDPTPLARVVLPDASVPAPLVFDVTDLVAAWAAGEATAAGILLRLAPADERFGAGGPKPPSSSSPLASRRPVLEVAFVPP
jgi:hypothetical protein